MALLLPLDEIEDLARRAGLREPKVEMHPLRDAIRVTDADGHTLDLEAAIFAAAARDGWRPNRSRWEPHVMRELAAFVAEQAEL